jgi:hypothetical protein
VNRRDRTRRDTRFSAAAASLAEPVVGPPIIRTPRRAGILSEEREKIKEV